MVEEVKLEREVSQIPGQRPRCIPCSNWIENWYFIYTFTYYKIVRFCWKTFLMFHATSSFCKQERLMRWSRYHLELDVDLSKRNSVSLNSFCNPKSNIKKYIEISRLKSKEETKHIVDYNRNLENEKLYKSSNQIYCLLHL